MKRIFFIGMICLCALSMSTLVGCMDKEDDRMTNYVDLGLPSKTKWRASNEGDRLYDYSEAMKKYGAHLPTEQQWEELLEECLWTWTGKGYKVTGPNKKSITLPAGGYRICEGNVYYVGLTGRYWSQSSDGEEKAVSMNFNSGARRIYSSYRCYGFSVRLVM